jgi:hypothetical protein
MTEHELWACLTAKIRHYESLAAMIATSRQQRDAADRRAGSASAQCDARRATHGAGMCRHCDVMLCPKNW